MEEEEEEEDTYIQEEKELLACTPAELVGRIERMRRSIHQARQAAGVREKFPRAPADIEDSIFMIQSTATLISEEELVERRWRINRQRISKANKYAKLAALELETFGSIEGKELKRLRLFAIKLLHVQMQIEVDPAWDGNIYAGGDNGNDRIAAKGGASLIMKQRLTAALNPKASFLPSGGKEEQLPSAAASSDRPLMLLRSPPSSSSSSSSSDRCWSEEVASKRSPALAARSSEALAEELVASGYSANSERRTGGGRREGITARGDQARHAQYNRRRRRRRRRRPLSRGGGR